MSELAERLEEYLELRRVLGFGLGQHRHYLPAFVAFLDAARASTVTVELAVAWARLPGDVKPITVDFRLGEVRGFARYLRAFDPDTEVPPPGLLAAGRHRAAPYVYSPDELRRIVQAARGLRPPLRAANIATVLGLIAATGMRITETLELSRADVDLVAGLITARHTKFDRSRLIPLHASVTAALNDYARTRDRLCPKPACERFFLTSNGGPLNRFQVGRAFHAVTTAVGVRTDTTHPRVHDLRHTFAVHTLIGWQREGADVNALLPVLSTYLGHVEPANTYWYLTAVPELMRSAADRLEQHTAGRP